MRMRVVGRVGQEKRRRQRSRAAAILGNSTIILISDTNKNYQTVNLFFHSLVYTRVYPFALTSGQLHTDQPQKMILVTKLDCGIGSGVRCLKVRLRQ